MRTSELNHFLKVLSDGVSDILIVGQDIGEKIRFSVDLKTYRKSRNELEFNFDSGERKQLERLLDGSGTLDFVFKEQKLAFSVQLKKILDKSILVTYPFCLYCEDRRSGERKELDTPILVNLTVKNRSLLKRCFDLGDGGFSLVIHKTDNIVLSEGMVLPDTKFELMGKEYKVTAKVVRKIDLKKIDSDNFYYGGYRVSFQFINMDDILKQRLKNQIQAMNELSDE